MLDKNASIEQLIYTAGGTHEAGKDSGNFGVWSASENLSDIYIQNELIRFANIVRDADKENYNTKYVNVRRLKAGAKPNLFGKYKEKDYEYVRNVSRNKIEIINQSTEQPLKFACDYNDDFRNNPEKAPYRIGAMQLSDNRLVICRINYINRIYSDRDTRTGNFFEHFYIFPKGTQIEDIDISKIDFKLGLEKKYWGATAEVAPEFLPELTYEEIQKTASNPLDVLYDLTVEYLNINNKIKELEDAEKFDLADKLFENSKHLQEKIKQQSSSLDMDEIITYFTKKQNILKEQIIKDAESKGKSSARLSGVWLKDTRFKATSKIINSAMENKEKNKTTTL